MTATLHLGDCLDHLRAMPDSSIDAVVTDPPYGLSAPPDIDVVLRAWLSGEAYLHGSSGFMGSAWDSFVPGPRVWREVLRVLKPGGHAVIFAGARTVDLMGIAVRMAGFEVRDCGQWNYHTGFPKSLDLSKEMDRLAGVEREILGVAGRSGAARLAVTRSASGDYMLTAPSTDNARQWEGWGTAIKPSVEPWLLLRKPLTESSIAHNVLRWGTGGLNIDACRFAPGDPMWLGPSEGTTTIHSQNVGSSIYGDFGLRKRHPANLVHCPKASRAERELGCERLPPMSGAEATGSKEGQARLDSPRTGAGRSASEVRNFHPTVKPVRLMQWLCRLVTPPEGVILDPFMGSGTTGVAAVSQGFDFVGCELEADHYRICHARISHAATGRNVESEIESEPVAKGGQVELWR